LKAGDRPEYEVKNTTNEQGDYIWLPNSLIVGVKGESSPVNRLKKGMTNVYSTTLFAYIFFKT
jgi:hypothetical protein